MLIWYLHYLYWLWAGFHCPPLWLLWQTTRESTAHGKFHVTKYSFLINLPITHRCGNKVNIKIALRGGDWVNLQLYIEAITNATYDHPSQLWFSQFWDLLETMIKVTLEVFLQVVRLEATGSKNGPTRAEIWIMSKLIIVEICCAVYWSVHW